MRTLLKTITINVAALYILSLVVPAVIVDGGVKGYLVVATTLFLLNLVVKPILNLLFLPLNILTLGMFRWVTSTIILWLATILVATFHIGTFHFAGFTYQGILLPAMDLSIFWTTVIAAFLFSIITSFLDWTIEK